MVVDLKFNEILGSSLGVYTIARPVIPAPVEIVKEIVVPGRSGMLHEHTGLYKELNFEVELNFKDKINLPEKWRAIKKWLLSGPGRLNFTDDPGIHYRISKVELGELERTSGKIGTFKAVFYTDALSYLDSGIVEVKARNMGANPGNKHRFLSMENEGIKAFPVFRIVNTHSQTPHESDFFIKVSDSSGSSGSIYFDKSITEDIIIDTERMLIYSNSGNLYGKTRGNIEDCFLRPYEVTKIDLRDSTFNIDSRMELYVKPNWRSL